MQMFADGLIDSGNKSIDGAVPSMSAVEDAFIHRILSVESAENLVGKKIICKEHPGVLVDSMEFLSEDEQREGFIMGIHLEFVFDDPDRRLIPGDCGSLVYLAEKKDGKLPIIGMFFGQLIRKKQVHCALILDWNIKLAMQTQELKLKDIKLAGHSPDVLLDEALNEDLPLPLPASGIDDRFSVSVGGTMGSGDHTLESGVPSRKNKDGVSAKKEKKADGNHDDTGYTYGGGNRNSKTGCPEMDSILVCQAQKLPSREKQENPEFPTRNAKQPGKKSENNNHRFPRQKAE